MKKHFTVAFNALFGTGLVAASLALLVWDIGKLRQAGDSRGWPQAEGVVATSDFGTSRSAPKPHVLYTYTVAGTTYQSTQISFDVFNNPGGEGQAESIIARYPAGKQVRVYYDPGRPEVAILEPEVYSPFYFPLFMSVVILFVAAVILVKTYQFARGDQPDPGMTASQRVLATAFVSVIIYGLFVLASLESSGRETFVKAFGEYPAGIPNIYFVLVLQTLLYIPVPWIFWHLMQLTSQAIQDGTRPGIVYLLSVGSVHPRLRRSQMVCLLGIAYLFLIAAVWTLYALAPRA